MDTRPAQNVKVAKPTWLGPDRARTFQHRGVAVAYRHRPPYPAEVFELLLRLIGGGPRIVLDIGAGTGALARPLASQVDRVHAVDWSAAMVEEGRLLPGGDHPNLVWTVDAAETVALLPPYGLVTAGASLHWMDWDIVLPRLAHALAPSGVLAIVDQAAANVSWGEDLIKLILRYTTSPEAQADFDLTTELERRRLLKPLGRRMTSPMPFRQSLDDYVEHWHSRQSLARERMTTENAAAFDAGVRTLVRSHSGDEEVVELDVVAEVSWGRPLRH